MHLQCAAAAKLVASIGAAESQHFVVLYLRAEGLQRQERFGS